MKMGASLEFTGLHSSDLCTHGSCVLVIQLILEFKLFKQLFVL